MYCFNHKIYYDMYIYVLFNILNIFTALWAILFTVVKNEKHVRSSDSHQHVMKLTQIGLKVTRILNNLYIDFNI